MRNRIRVLRAEHRWTQDELAKRLGVSRNSIVAIENERHDPSLSIAFKIAEVFALPIEQIFQKE